MGNKSFISGFILCCLALSLAIPAHCRTAGRPGGGETSHVICEMDSSQSYFLFLPSYYTEDELWPVIYIFDPSGMGKRALELFTPAAEEFGYILSASNSTENGPWEPFLKGANAMFRDLESRYKIDPMRRYTAGFSGAAASASALAVMYDGILGVLGCGSGFSLNYAPHFDVDFSYIGLIGDRDFHFQEMQNLDIVLNRFRLDHYIQVYPGGHDWPPPEYIRQAFLWFQFKAMKHDIIAIDDGLVVSFYNEHVQLAESLEADGNMPGAYESCLKILAFLDGLKRLDKISEMKERYFKSSEFQQYTASKENLALKEKAYISVYLEAFNGYKTNYADGMSPIQPIKWWKQQIKGAEAMVIGGETPSDTLLGRRLIDYIWRNAYTFYKSVAGTELDPISIRYLDIWKIAQPYSISPYFFSAQYYTRYGKADKAIDNLKAAVRHGLEDPLLLENDPVLQQLRSEPEFLSITQHLWAQQETP